MIIVVIRWTGLAPWEFDFPFPGGLTSTFLEVGRGLSDTLPFTDLLTYRGTSLIIPPPPRRTLQ